MSTNIVWLGWKKEWGWVRHEGFEYYGTGGGYKRAHLLQYLDRIHVCVWISFCPMTEALSLWNAWLIVGQCRMKLEPNVRPVWLWVTPSLGRWAPQLGCRSFTCSKVIGSIFGTWGALQEGLPFYVPSSSNKKEWLKRRFLCIPSDKRNLFVLNDSLFCADLI